MLRVVTSQSGRVMSRFWICGEAFADVVAEDEEEEDWEKEEEERAEGSSRTSNDISIGNSLAMFPDILICLVPRASSELLAVVVVDGAAAVDWVRESI